MRAAGDTHRTPLRGRPPTGAPIETPASRRGCPHHGRVSARWPPGQAAPSFSTLYLLLTTYCVLLTTTPTTRPRSLRDIRNAYISVATVPASSLEPVAPNMQLLLIRHGIAEDQAEFAKTKQDDSLRPLTKEGRWKWSTRSAACDAPSPRSTCLRQPAGTRSADGQDHLRPISRDRDHNGSIARANGSFDSFLTWLKKQRAVPTVGPSSAMSRTWAASPPGS